MQDTGTLHPQTRSRLSISPGLIGLLVAVALLAAAVGLWRGGSGTSSYPVDIRVPSTRMTAAEVATSVLERLQQMRAQQDLGVAPAIDSMVALPLSQLPTVDESAGHPDPGTVDANATVWFVRAHGTFIGSHVAPGANPIVESTGYLLVDDQTGDFVGMGMP
ncbi:MAG TPA: hypothetical protein VKR30_01060 [Candidatus Limnocylindrales bacterium]|nr:hypothetical protein [Candidatus Limnocylindrales bacterium]